jgi:hypothetical protein
MQVRVEAFRAELSQRGRMRSALDLKQTNFCSQLVRANSQVLECKPVTSRDLQPHQIEKLKSHLRRQLSYLNRLCGRMQRLGFPIDDPLVRGGTVARNAVQDLYTATMYCGKKEGVGLNPSSRER